MSDSASPTMRAAVVEASARGHHLTVQSWPRPTVASDEVLVRVAASALNRADLSLLQNLTGPGLRPRHLPRIPGVDLAGTIDEVGSAAHDLGWRTGDRVVAYPGMFCGACAACRVGETSMCSSYQIIGEERDGGLAEVAAVPARNLLRVPAEVPFEVAAAAPATFTTAWRMLFGTARIQPGATVLITAAGSGVSVAAMALAHLAGARILATTRHEDKAERAMALGVDAVHVGYDEPFDAWVMECTDGRGVDVVIDSVGAATWRPAIRSLAPGGALVVCGATSGDTPDISIRELYQQHRRILGAPLGSYGEFVRVMDLVFRGKVTPVIDRLYPLDEVGEAFARLADQRQFGKIVIQAPSA